MERFITPPKVEFVLGSHDNNNIQGLNCFKSVIEKGLANNHKILVVLEASDCPYNTALAQEFCINEAGKLPSQVEEAFYQSSHPNIDLEKEPTFTYMLSKILDEFFIACPTSLQICQEGLPRDILNPKSTFWRYSPLPDTQMKFGKNFTNRWFNREIRSAVKMVLAGKFEEGLSHFKPPIRSLAVEMPLRDHIITLRIIDKLSKDPHISFVTGFWGSAHTGIIHQLKNTGIDAKGIFCDKEGDRYYYNASTAMARALRFGKDVSDLEWEKALLCDSIQTTLLAIRDKQPAELQPTDQKIFSMTWAALSVLKDEEAVREFKQQLFKQRLTTKHWLTVWASLID